MTITTSRNEAGFSLVEVLIATAIMLTITGGIFTLLNPAGAMFQAQPEVTDMQQRLRIGVDALTRDLTMAGAGAYSGVQTGSLNGYFTPIIPAIVGNVAGYNDPPGTFKTNAITVFYVPSTFSQTSLAAPMANIAAPLSVNNEFGCPANQPVCGFKVGMSVLLYDGTGAFDTMTVSAVGANGTASLQHNMAGDLSIAYPAGTRVVQVQQHTYFLNVATRQLMHYDGLNAPTPLLDEVVGLNFEYYGDPQPPAMLDTNGLKANDVTYGIKPTKLGTNNPPTGFYGAYQTCTITAVGVAPTQTQAPRLAVLGAAGSGLVQMTQAQMTDGPWCPDPANANGFDADLFRIRKIRVTLRLQTGNSALRGSGSLATGPNALFLNAGTGTGSRLVGDQQIRFDVSPRNMNLAR